MNVLDNEMGEDAADFGGETTSRVGFVHVICEAAISYVCLKFSAWGTNLASVLKFSSSIPLALQRKSSTECKISLNDRAPKWEAT